MPASGENFESFSEICRTFQIPQKSAPKSRAVLPDFVRGGTPASQATGLATGLNVTHYYYDYTTITTININRQMNVITTNYTIPTNVPDLRISFTILQVVLIVSCLLIISDPTSTY